MSKNPFAGEDPTQHRSDRYSFEACDLLDGEPADKMAHEHPAVNSRDSAQGLPDPEAAF